MLVTGEDRVIQQFATIEVSTVIGDDLVRTLGVQYTFGNQLVCVELARAGMLLDLLVHQRLRDHGLILLVVTELAIADDVDHDILLEGLAVFDCQAGNQRHRFRVIPIDMEDGRFGHLEDVGAVQG
ncbi:MAG: hypothetical protein AW09_001029 [Candidatus Accumulibacter phosphatis]|uniref:Uncharacterized protein n=1 Tax=Candidatus Accumulibacter phosphatis TaxID=327160 RepID=A0A080LXT1_9PROT|nr:MAG: hypothetical protein AW09_001029 [Candidatus Accumulibacter phosphatis]